MSLLFTMGVPGRESRTRIEQLRVLLEQAASDAEAAESEEREAAQERDRLKQEHPEYHNRAAVLVPQVIFVLAGAFGIYALDYLFLSPITRFIVGTKFGRDSWVVIVAQFAVPAGVMLLESLLSLARHRAQEHATETLAGSTAFLWTCLALLLGLVVPAGVIAAFMAGHYDFPVVISAPLLLALVALAAAAHLVIIFGFSLVQESLSFVSVNIQIWRQSREANAARGEYRRQEQIALAAWPRYLDRIDHYNATYPGRQVRPGPFSACLQRFLHHVYGEEVIRRDSSGGNGRRPTTADGGVQLAMPGPGTDADELGAGPEPPAATPPPTPPRPGAAAPPPALETQSAEDGRSQGEMEYYRSVLAAQIRDMDGEVTA